jgi:hypothetical protein
LRAAAHLPGANAVLNMGQLFELVDGVRELKSALETPINRGLAVETLLRRFRPSRGSMAPPGKGTAGAPPSFGRR